MDRWHVEAETKSSERGGARMRGAQSRKGGGGSRETAVDESKETDGRQGSKALGRLLYQVVNIICLRNLMMLRLPCVLL